MVASEFPADPIPMGFINEDGLVEAITSDNPLPTSGGGGGGGNVTVVNAANNAAYIRPGTGTNLDTSNVTITNAVGSGVYIRPGTGVNLNTSAVTVSAALPAGTNNIGDVDVLTLPALPAGNNNIGDVDVASLPSLPAGNNNIGDVDVVTLPSLPAGTNAIGKLAANSGVDIGDVDVTSVAAPSTIRYAQESVGTGAAALGSNSVTQGVTVKASRGNAGIIYIGGNSSVTSSNGYALAAGEMVFVACQNANQVFAIASQSSQTLYVLGS